MSIAILKMMLAQYLFNRRRAKRITVQKDNYEEWGEEEFRRYQLSKATTSQILEEIRHRVEFATERSSCLPVMEQLLMTLHFYATAGSCTSIGNTCCAHKATAGRVIQ